MLQPVTWRSWAALAALFGIYLGCGLWLAGNGAAEGEIYKWGLTTLVIVPLMLMAIYTAKRARWWANDVGAAMAQLAFGISWTAWPLAYAFWFLGGRLSAGFLAWTEISGPGIVTLAILRLCWIFARAKRSGND